MTQRVSSTPCDASGGEATKEAPLLDLEKCAPEEQAAPSPWSDADATTCGQWFLRTVLGAVWLYVVNQMRMSYSACEDAETRAMMAVLMVVLALSLACVFGTICKGEKPVDAAARSYTSAPSGSDSDSDSDDEPSLFALDVTNGIHGLAPYLAER